MQDIIDNSIGAAWLVEHFKLQQMAPLPVSSRIGTRRATEAAEGFRLETYSESMRPDGTPAAHLQFHLRHEVPQLEFLVRLFARSGGHFVQEWVSGEPTGQYARRAAFLYEWLTGGVLQVPERLAGNYVDALDDTKQVAASPETVIKNVRWRVNDNLPGTRYFCPTIVKTDAFVHAAALDVKALFANLTDEFGEELLLRAAAWMTLRESKSSFVIEGEGDRTTRIQRFADVMGRRTGEGEQPLTDAASAELQREILGDITTVTHFGFRQSPVFVGESVRFSEVIHYVAPVQEDVADMMEGLRVFLARTHGQSPVMRSTVAAFGYVYVHPMADGNGRVHRFLINDVLRRDGVIPAPVILPLSAVITDDAGERRSYAKVLDQVSVPLMRVIRENVSFAPTRTRYPDGVVSNLQFNGEDVARPLWRHLDLTPHVVYLSKVIERTITEQMREESKYLRNHAQARLALKEIVEMPDEQADRVLRSIDQNKGQLSNVLAKEMPVLELPGIWVAVVEAVEAALRNEARADPHVVERYHPTKQAGK